MTRKDHYRDLKLLVAGMRPEEIDVAKKFIVSFDSNVTLKTNKSLKLFKLLVQKPHTSRHVACELVSKGVSESSFDRLIKRLKEKLLESLLLNINTKRKELHPPAHQLLFRLRKQLMQAQVLLARGLRSEAASVLDKTIGEARKCELYDVLLEALRVRRTMLAVEGTEAAFNQNAAEASKYTIAAEMLHRAEEYYLRQFFATGSKEPALSAAVKELNEAYKSTGSTRIGHHALGLQVQACLNAGKPTDALTAALQRLQLVRANLELFPDHAIGTALHDLAYCQLNIMEVNSALSCAREAKSYFNRGDWEYDRAVELETRALIYNNDLQQAMIGLNENLNGAEAALAPTSPMSTYLKAAILFQLKDHGGCRELLQEAFGLGLVGFGPKLLQLLNTITEGRLQLNSKYLRTMAVDLEALKNALPELNERQQCIIEVCEELVGTRLRFDTVQDVQAANLRSISTDPNRTWHSTTSEVVVFEHWFWACVRNRSYKFLPDNEMLPLEV